MHAPPDKRRTAPAGTKGGSKFDNVVASFEWPEHKIKTPPGSTLITITAASEISGEKPATIINWCAHLGIGGHVQTGRTGAWMVDPDRLERLLAELRAAS